MMDFSTWQYSNHISSFLVNSSRCSVTHPVMEKINLFVEAVLIESLGQSMCWRPLGNHQTLYKFPRVLAIRALPLLLRLRSFIQPSSKHDPFRPQRSQIHLPTQPHHRTTILPPTQPWPHPRHLIPYNYPPTNLPNRPPHRLLLHHPLPLHS